MLIEKNLKEALADYMTCLPTLQFLSSQDYLWNRKARLIYY